HDFTQLLGHESRVDEVVVSSDGSLLASRDVAGTVLIWSLSPELVPDRPRALVSIPDGSAPANRVVLSPDGKFLASFCFTVAPAVASVFETTHGEIIARLHGDDSTIVVGCEFDDRSRRLALAGEGDSGKLSFFWWEFGRAAPERHSWLQQEPA